MRRRGLISTLCRSARSHNDASVLGIRSGWRTMRRLRKRIVRRAMDRAWLWRYSRVSELTSYRTTRSDRIISVGSSMECADRAALPVGPLTALRGR